MHKQAHLRRVPRRPTPPIAMPAQRDPKPRQHMPYLEFAETNTQIAAKVQPGPPTKELPPHEPIVPGKHRAAATSS